MICVDNEKRRKTPSTSGIGRAASCPGSAESSVVIHQSAKIRQKDRWIGMMRVDGGPAGITCCCCNDHLMRPSRSTDDSLMALAEDVSTGRSSELGQWP